MSRRTAAPAPARRGRPRSTDADDAILDATVRQLADVGYHRLSLEGVAAAASVGKPTLYRRWPTKADLVMAALARGIDIERTPPADADTETALVLLLRTLRERLLRPNAMALVGTLLAEEAQTPELIALFRERVWGRRAAMARDILARGKARGDVRADADVEAVVGMLIGAIYAQYLSGARVPRTWPERTVAVVLRGIRAR